MYIIKEKYWPYRCLSKHTEDLDNILHCHMASWTDVQSDSMLFENEPTIMKILGTTWYEIVKV